MAAKNPFELSKKKVVSQPKRATTPRAPRAPPTEVDIQRQLVGYLEMSEDLWPEIKRGTHVRYFLKASDANPGGFRLGGFVMKNPHDKKTADGSVSRQMMLSHVLRPTPHQSQFWSVKYSSFEKLYVKADASDLSTLDTLESVVRDMNANTRKVADYVVQLSQNFKVLTQRVKALEEMLQEGAKIRAPSPLPSPKSTRR